MHDLAVETEKVPLPDGWRQANLRYLVRCLDGQRVPLNAVQRGPMGGPFPYWGANKVIDYVNRWLFDEPLVLLGEDGAPFFERKRDVAFAVTGRIWVNNHCHVLRCGDRIVPRYLAYWLNCVDYSRFVSGSTRDKLTQRSMGSIPIALPCVDEQRLIVRYLDHAELRIGRALSAKRELLRLLDESEAALRWTALTSGFGQQTAVPTTAPWMGALPEDWRPTRLKALLREIDHRSKTGSEPLLSLRMREGLVVSSEYSDRPQDQSKLVGYKIINPGEVVMNRMRASIGLFGIADQRGLVSPDYATFTERGPVHLPYLLFLLKSPQMGAVIRSESRGLGTGHSGFLRIYTDRFGAIPVVLPCVAEQRVRAVEAETRTGALRDAQRAALRKSIYSSSTGPG